MKTLQEIKDEVSTPTADYIYIKWFGANNTTTRRSIVKNNIIKAMEEYAGLVATQALIDASERAELKYKKSKAGVTTFEVNKQSILSTPIKI